MQSSKSELQKKDVLRLSNEQSNKITKECMQTALLMLLEHKPLEKITITELVARSGVSRSAFYRNYNTKEDILDEITEKVVKYIKDASAQIDAYDKYDFFRYYLQALKDNARTLSLLLQVNFLSHIFQNNNLLDKLYDDIPQNSRYQRIGLSGAFANIVICWISDGMKESVEEMARICADFFDDSVLKKH